MAGKGGGAWKVAYADFVTAMMAFFMVMWLTAQKPDVKEAVAKHFRDPYDLEELDMDSEEGSKGGGSTKSKSGKQHGMGPGKATSKSNNPDDPDSLKPKILIIRPSEITGSGTVVFFDGTSAELDADAKDMLNRFAPVVNGKPNKIEIRGHAQRQSEPGGDPWSLSYQRTLATMQYLESKGISQKQIRLSQAGPNEPLSLKINNKTHRSNPRVEVLVLAEWVDDLVGTPEERAERIQTEERPTNSQPEEHAEEEHGKEKDSHPVDAPAKPEHDAEAHATKPADNLLKKPKGQAFARPFPEDQAS